MGPRASLDGRKISFPPGFYFVPLWLCSVFYGIYIRNNIGTIRLIVMFYCLFCSDVCSLGHCVSSWTSTPPGSSVTWLSDIPIPDRCP